MAGYIPGFDVVRYDAKGFMHRVTGGTVTLYNETASTSIGTRAISSDGIVAMGSITGSVGDVVRVSHGSYAGTVQFTLTATQDEAFTTTDNAAATFVVEDLRSTTTQTDAATAYLIDLDNPNVKPRRLGVFKADATTLIPLDQAAVEKNYRVKWVSRDQNFADTGFNLGTAPSADVTVPAISGIGGGDVTGDASSTDKAVVLWNGTSGTDIQNSTMIYDTVNRWLAGLRGIDLSGSSSGAVKIRVPAAAGTNTITLPAGTTDFSATGGSKRFVRQDSAGAALTVDSIHGADLTLNLKTVYLEQYGHTNSGLAAAITAVGSTRSLLIITEDLTVSTSQTIPATCLVRIDNGAKILPTSNATVTIGNFRSPGHVQCFGAIDANNHVVFGAGAVEHYDLTWYMGLSSSSNCTYAINDIITSVNSSGGGTMYLPNGSWKVHEITVPNYFEVYTTGQGQDSSGGRLIPYDSSTTYLVRSTGNVRNFKFTNVVFSDNGSTTCELFRIHGTSGSSGFGGTFDNCTFHGSGTTSRPTQVNFSTDAAYEFIGLYFKNCQWITVDGSKSFYCDTINTSVTFNTCRIQNGSGSSYGLDFYRCGYIKVINPDFRGSGGSYATPSTSIGTVTCTISTGGTALEATSGTFTRAMLGQRVFKSGNLDSRIIDIIDSTHATVSTAATTGFTAQVCTIYKYVDNTSRSGYCIRLGDIASADIDMPQNEGYNYFLTIIGVGYDRPIRINGGKIQDKIHIDGSCSLYLNGPELYSNTFSDTSGTDARIYCKSPVSATTVQGVTLTKANHFGPDHAGGSVFLEDLGYRTGHYQDDTSGFRRHLETTGSALTRPLFEVATTYESDGVVGQLLQRWSLYDSVSRSFLYGLSLYRDDPAVNPGYWVEKTTQAHPYNGKLFGFVTGYTTDVKADVTQTTSRTATVSANGATGIITLYTYASTVLEAGESIAFTFNNTYIKNGCDFRVEVIDGASSTLTKAWSSDWGGNAATIRVMNLSQTTDENGSAIKLKYRIEADGGQAGIVP